MTTEIMPINARGAIPVHLSTTLEISLSASDVMRWLDTVTDVENLAVRPQTGGCHREP